MAQVLDIQDLNERPIGGQDYFTVLVDRFVLNARSKKRIHDSLEQAFRYGKGRLILIFPDDDNS